MISIDLTLKYSPMPVSVQRKEKDGAEALYQTIVTAMQGDRPQLLELTCEKQTEKKVAIMSDQISAVIVSEKDGAASAGKVPGFAALGQIVNQG
ncbi:hypothetical protein [Synechocystis sp. CACIAM 05]|uniref:hypothetical protein n=1 Tax=Synechocystis sp. CACIAM 05 TaxID=1933929 RepID=UPI00138E7C4E|nr:hypothetical protein [Synechocystis sp. CACIAM 05]QHU99012.1 hypothetical protein BWK47_01935 [Synechocystis sp. CACIAM 05]